MPCIENLLFYARQQSKRNGLFAVPCGPAHVHAEVQCPSGVLSMGWDRTEDAAGYTTSVISGSTGEHVYCNSTSATCSLSNLQCGESYSIQVRSYNGTCLSMPTKSLVIREGEVLIYLQKNQQLLCFIMYPIYRTVSPNFSGFLTLSAFPTSAMCAHQCGS